MQEPRSNPVPTTRTAIAGLSALLVVGVILGTTLATIEPGFRDGGREYQRDLAPARQFKVSLAKAVQKLVGDHHRPATLERSPIVVAAAAPLAVGGSQLDAPGVIWVRAALLNLPPPVALV